MQFPILAKRYAFTQVVKLSPIAASKLLYWNRFKNYLNPVNPKTPNRKLIWLKLFEDVEFRRSITDKVKACEYDYSRNNYLLPSLIGIFEKFVLKCSQGNSMTNFCN